MFSTLKRWTRDASAGKSDRSRRTVIVEPKACYPKPDPRAEATWVALRTPAALRGPSPDALALLAHLPAGLLEQTARDYPHLIEKFAANWLSPQSMHKVFDSLTFETRSGRQGFPFEVLSELTDLRERYENAQPR